VVVKADDVARERFLGLRTRAQAMKVSASDARVSFPWRT
jgi:hypothetical protein